LGDHRVLARPGPQRGRPLWVLDPLAAAIWGAARAGLTAEEIAVCLAARFQLPLKQARAAIACLLASEDDAMAAVPLWTLHLADRRIALTVDDPVLAAPLERITHHLWAENSLPPDTCLHLAGTAAAWRLEVNGVTVVAGAAPDDAVARTVADLAVNHSSNRWTRCGCCRV